MYDSTQPVRQDQLFVGRHSLLEGLRDNIRSTVYIGEARIGRTSLLLAIERQLAGTSGYSGPRVPIYLNLRKPNLQSPGDVYLTLFRAISKRVEQQLGKALNLVEPTATVGVEDLIALLDDLDLRHAQYEILVLLDNLDHPEGFIHSRLDFFRGLRKLLDFAPKQSLKILSTASYDFLFLESTIVSKLRGRLQVRRMSSLSSQDTQELIEVYDAIRSSPQRDLIFKYAYDVTGGHPCLLQELMSSITNLPMQHKTILKSLEAEVRKLEVRGGSFFDHYLRELPLDEIGLLVSLAFSPLDNPPDLPVDSIDRFSCAGLLPPGAYSAPRASCKLFFSWLRENLSRVLPERLEPSRDLFSLGGLRQRLETQLQMALTSKMPRDEKELQIVLQGMLAAYNLPFKREEVVETAGKKPRIDFGVERLNCALEVKVLKSSRDVGRVIDQLLADMELYKSGYACFLAIIVAPKEYARLQRFIEEYETPFCQISLIKVAK